MHHQLSKIGVNYFQTYSISTSYTWNSIHSNYLEKILAWFQIVRLFLWEWEFHPTIFSLVLHNSFKYGSMERGYDRACRIETSS